VAAYFFDTSALAKRYVTELGSAWVRRLVRPAAGNAIHIARITGVEVVAAITRRGRSGSLSARAAAAARTRFRREFRSLYILVDVTAQRLADAMDLAEVHGLRGYDAVQLAAALHLKSRRLIRRQSPPTFVSADRELNAAASTEGLAVDDPNNHP
jgi:predicted nucleic acid-binding protein